MKISFLHEPELQFGDDKHLDIRFGIANYHPLDYRDQLAPKNIQLGIVGTDKTISELRSWLDVCAAGIPAKPSNQPNLFPAFPGFGTDTPFDAKLVFDSRLERQVSIRSLPKTVDRKEYNTFLKALADAYIAEADITSEKGATVIVCALPMEALNLIDPDDPESEDEDQDAKKFLEQDFHDLLKARAMQIQRIKPIQLVLPTTYSDTAKRRQRKKKENFRKLQDPATRAWNFHTALYYKAGGSPWRLIRDEADLTCCFVGVSFYKTLDGSEVYTSSAQVFNERGQGVIVRGSPAKVAKDDRTINMSSEGAYTLIKDALAAYRGEHKTMPARVVIHKTSGYNQDEIDGFEKGITERDIELPSEVADYLRDELTVVDRNGAIKKETKYRTALDRYAVLLQYGLGHKVDRGSKYWQALERARDLRDYYTHIDAMNSRALSSDDVFDFLETVMLGIIWPSSAVGHTLQRGIFDLYWMWDQLRELAGNVLPEGHVEQPFFHGWKLDGRPHMFYCPFANVDNVKFPNTDEQMGRPPRQRFSFK